jgi:hypothetical protein
VSERGYAQLLGTPLGRSSVEPYSCASGVSAIGRAGTGSLGVLQAGAMSLGAIAHALIGGKPDGKRVLAPHSTRKAS